MARLTELAGNRNDLEPQISQAENYIYLCHIQLVTFGPVTQVYIVALPTGADHVEVS